MACIYFPQPGVEASLGYKQVLHRTWHTFEAFMAGFGSLYVVGGVRYLFSIGIYSGGPLALWTTMLATVVFMTITAASLAEICSSLPLSGSIYAWAGAAAGPKYGRFFAFIVAYWSTTAWTSFVASNTQGTINYILTELTVFNHAFPGGLDSTNIKFRAVQWICAEIFLLLAVLSNVLSPRKFTWVFKASAAIIAIDFFLTVIWLPIGVSKTYGFQPASFLMTTYNTRSCPSLSQGTGASSAWNYILAFLSSSGVLTGFDASGHIGEETKNASLANARGIFWSATFSGLLAFPLLILFLFCSPPLDTLFAIEAPQPFVLIYTLALGKGGQMVMTLVATVGLFVNTSLAILAASRLVFGIARDGVLPGSSWIGKVDRSGQPKNAIIFVGGVAAVLLCTILPSQVAFTSLISASGLPTIAAYALIPILRLLFTRHEFRTAKWSNGRFSELFCLITGIWNLFLITVLVSPYEWPVTAQNFNFSSVIFGAITLLAILTWWFAPEERWLSHRDLLKIIDGTHQQQHTATVDEHASIPEKGLSE
ncbi:BZ3500_MvSof-1268-A1-R1_Chr7-1g09122 [Microbotryum saponariae]|uniref:BZ3500_MvSof-1268-A1-R1_Chr7-1g09122 protein n=1 Tax=Microbotryum saponariae TaxID=289078 RepID=A0A2X0LUC9_9BASI|nr:BZ3501_MvSof-1269-A2-R1_Chr7-1g08827 [Microbotryum saponariae]SDA02843.1 BZ3500_MvSof-1268-A1-R1_Chr7-1g09122 [Microbotryum saponariae]